MKTREERKAEIAKLKKSLMESARVEFRAGANELFAAHPDLKSFGWTQYTPHFNDGETCEFSAHTDEPDINGYSEYGDEEDDAGRGVNIIAASRKTNSTNENGTWKDTPNPDYSKDHAATYKAVQDFLKEFDEEELEDMFGDHVKVKVTPKSAKTEEHDHD